MKVGMKLIFMGTPQFAVPSFLRLIEDGHDISAVFTQPDRPAGRGKSVKQPAVKAAALEHGLSVYQPEKIKKNEEVRSLLQSLSPDAGIVVGYGKILPQWLLDIPRLGCINVHASLLPKYRGAAPVNWAIASGERVTGVTIMQLDAGMDTGPILAQEPVEIGVDESAPELWTRLAGVGADLLSRTLGRLGRGDIRPVAQDDSQATYAPVLKKEDGLIDWGLRAGAISNRIRGFQPWPGSYTRFRGRRLIFWCARVDDSARVDAPPSTVLDVEGPGLRVACGEGTVLVIEGMQVEGRQRVTAREFVNGARIEPGVMLSDDWKPES